MDATTGDVAGASVQIGDPITEKLLIDVLRDAAGPVHRDHRLRRRRLSSAIGEMAEGVGAEVELASAAEVPGSGTVGDLAQRGAGADGHGRRRRCSRVRRARPAPRRRVQRRRRFTGDTTLVVRHGAAARPRHDVLARRPPARHLDRVLPVPVRMRRVAGVRDRGDAARAAGPPEHRQQGRVIRRYDHEILGATVIRPLMGRRATACDGVVLVDPADTDGIAIGIGVNPWYGIQTPSRWPGGGRRGDPQRRRGRRRPRPGRTDGQLLVGQPHSTTTFGELVVAVRAAAMPARIRRAVRLGQGLAEQRVPHGRRHSSRNPADPGHHRGCTGARRAAWSHPTSNETAISSCCSARRLPSSAAAISRCRPSPGRHAACASARRSCSSPVSRMPPPLAPGWVESAAHAGLRGRSGRRCSWRWPLGAGWVSPSPPRPCTPTQRQHSSASPPVSSCARSAPTSFDDVVAKSSPGTSPASGESTPSARCGFRFLLNCRSNRWSAAFNRATSASARHARHGGAGHAPRWVMPHSHSNSSARRASGFISARSSRIRSVRRVADPRRAGRLLFADALGAGRLFALELVTRRRRAGHLRRSGQTGHRHLQRLPALIRTGLLPGGGAWLGHQLQGALRVRLGAAAAVVASLRLDLHSTRSSARSPTARGALGGREPRTLDGQWTRCFPLRRREPERIDRDIAGDLRHHRPRARPDAASRRPPARPPSSPHPRPPQRPRPRRCSSRACTMQRNVMSACPPFTDIDLLSPIVASARFACLRPPDDSVCSSPPTGSRRSTAGRRRAVQGPGAQPAVRLVVRGDRRHRRQPRRRRARPQRAIGVSAQPLPVEVIVRGYITGVTVTSLWRHMRRARASSTATLPDGLQQATAAADTPIITPTTKAEQAGRRAADLRARSVERGLVEAELWDAGAGRCTRAVRTRPGAGGECRADPGRHEVRVRARPRRRADADRRGAHPDSSRFWVAATYDARIAAARIPRASTRSSCAAPRGRLPPARARSRAVTTVWSATTDFATSTPTNGSPG